MARTRQGMITGPLYVRACVILPARLLPQWAEHKRTGDVHFMFSRDTYMDLPTKTLEVL